MVGQKHYILNLFMSNNDYFISAQSKNGLGSILVTAVANVNWFWNLEKYWICSSNFQYLKNIYIKNKCFNLWFFKITFWNIKNVLTEWRFLKIPILNYMYLNLKFTFNILSLPFFRSQFKIYILKFKLSLSVL